MHLRLALNRLSDAMSLALSGLLISLARWSWVVHRAARGGGREGGEEKGQSRRGRGEEEETEGQDMGQGPSVLQRFLAMSSSCCQLDHILPLSRGTRTSRGRVGGNQKHLKPHSHDLTLTPRR